MDRCNMLKINDCNTFDEYFTELNFYFDSKFGTILNKKIKI